MESGRTFPHLPNEMTALRSLKSARHISPEQIRQVLQAHTEDSSLRGISWTTGLAYNTVVSLVRSASHKAQSVHNREVNQVETEEVSADEMWRQ